MVMGVQKECSSLTYRTFLDNFDHFISWKRDPRNSQYQKETDAAIQGNLLWLYDIVIYVKCG